MDGEKFDALLRRAFGDGSRRGVLRVGIGALAASDFGGLGLSAIEDARAKNRREARRRRARRRTLIQEKKKTKAKQSPPEPPGPPGPGETCSGNKLHECGSGCCPVQRPLCCHDALETSGKSCWQADNVCCPLAFGGGACDDADEQCCPPNSGGICFTDEDCCPSAFTNEDNLGCCPADVNCCNDRNDCGVDEECIEGCSFAL